jgi:hypothetical protein
MLSFIGYVLSGCFMDLINAILINISDTIKVEKTNFNMKICGWVSARCLLLSS